MPVYLTSSNTFVGTQAEIPKGEEIHSIDIPGSKAEMITFLNEMAQHFIELGKRSVEPDTKPQAAPAPEAAAVPPSRTEQLISFEDAWEGFPLALKAHYASLFCEEARCLLKP